MRDKQPTSYPSSDPLAPDRLEQLLGASRGIQLEQATYSRVKLSKFTLRQISREKKLYRRNQKANPRKHHYQTRRRLDRERCHRRVEKYYRLKSKYGQRWQVTLEEWTDILWPYIGEQPIRVGTYEKNEVMTVYSLWIEAGDGTRLWEGAEEKLRELGCLV